MQPLPSGLPPTIPLSHPPPPPSSSPPPPPPPPRLSIAAFTSAAANAGLYPPSRRRPTLHIVVVLGSATVPLLRHAHQALCSLSAKGVHVFLQTEVERVGAPTVTPITPDAVPDVVAACRADFLVLIADRNVPSRTVQVRLSPAADFVDVPLADLADAVLTAWAQQLRAVPDRLQRLSLAMNPNVVTSAQLDLLLQSYSHIPSIRRSYAKLARLVNVTQTWQYTDAGDETNESNSPKRTGLEPNTPAGPAQTSFRTESREKEPQEESDLPASLVHKALRTGLRTVMRLQRGLQSAGPQQTPKSDLTFSWLKRSERMCARLLRSQLLASEMHHKLLDSLDTITHLPIAPTSFAPFNGGHLPTEAHRQRLLREVNDLVPRIEELGMRLSKRPRTRRRRRVFHEANPWISYVRQTKTLPRGGWSVAATLQSTTMARVSTWRCCACRAANEQSSTSCAMCHLRTHILTEHRRPKNTERLTKRFQGAFKNTQGAPSPWVFAPGVLPLQPPLGGGMINGIVGGDSPVVDNRPSQRRADDSSLAGMHDMSFGSPPFRDGSTLQFQPFDITGAFQSMTFEDDRKVISDESTQRSTGSFGYGGATRRSPPRSGMAFSASPPSQSPLRLASSAPNGPSQMDFVPEHVPNGIRHRTSPAAVRGQQLVGNSPQRASTSDEQDFTHGGPASLLVGSFPGSNAFAGSMPFGVSPAKTSSQVDEATDPNQRNRLLSSAGHTTRRIVANGSFNSPMEELARGSYEATDKRHRFSSTGRRTSSNPIAVPGSKEAGEGVSDEITSLEALAAASDAANGGTGSATTESLRAVSAVVTPGRGQASKSSRPQGNANGVYNMF